MSIKLSYYTLQKKRKRGYLTIYIMNHKTNISLEFFRKCTRKKKVWGSRGGSSKEVVLFYPYTYITKKDRIVANLNSIFFPFKIPFLNTSSTILLGNVRDKIAYTTRVTPFIIVPSDELDKVGVQLDSSLGIKDGGGSVAYEIGGNEGVLSVLDDALVFTFSGLLDDLLYFLVGSTFLSANHEVDNGNIDSRNTE